VIQGSIGDIAGQSVVRPYVSEARRYGDVARLTGVIKHC
jgi:hypothetical protein